MTYFYTHIIPLFLITIELILIYWAIKLDKIQDYKFSLIRKYKSFKRLLSQLQRKLFKSNKLKMFPSEQTGLKQIKLQQSSNSCLQMQKNKRKTTTISQLDKEQRLKITRKNSIDYKIYINQCDDKKLNHVKDIAAEAENINSPHTPLKTNTNIQFHQKNNLGTKNNIKTKIILNPIISNTKVRLQPIRSNIQSANQPQKGNYYLNVYQKLHNQQLQSRKSLASINNFSSKGSNINIPQQRVSFRNLFEQNGIKTIRDLIKEGV